MPATYATKHHRNKAPRYMRWIPKALQPLFLGKDRITKQLPPMPERDAAKALRREALATDRLFDALEKLTPGQRVELVAAGGVDATVKRIDALTAAVEHHLPTDLLLDAPRRPDFEAGWNSVKVLVPGVTLPPFDVERSERFTFAMLRTQRAELAELEALRPLAPLSLTAEPSAEFSLDGLYTNWLKTEPKVTRKHSATLALFKQCMGKPMDYRSVTPDDCWQFLKSLEESGASVIVCKKHLDNMRGMFKAARQHVRTNPAAGVNSLGKAVETPRMVLSGPQTAAILEAAADRKLGGKRDVARHTELLWVLKVMVHTGMRPGEVTQLQRGDLAKVGDVFAINVRQTCCVTGARHPQKSVKGGLPRNVPLVSELEDFYTWAKDDNKPGEFVFSCFSFSTINKRVAPVGEAFRKIVGMMGMKPPPGQLLDSYCLRHRFIGAGRDKELSDKHMEYVTGHAPDLHDKYGRGVGQKRLYETMKKVRPLAD